MEKSQNNLSKDREKLLKDLKLNPVFIEKMAFTKEKFFPALVEASKSVNDAKIFLTSMSNILMDKFLAKMKEVKMSELNLTEILDKKSEKYEEFKKLIALFDDKDLFTSKELLEGMKGEIDLWINEEFNTRKLSDLKLKWLDEV